MANRLNAGMRHNLLAVLRSVLFMVTGGKKNWYFLICNDAFAKYFCIDVLFTNHWTGHDAVWFKQT